MEGYRSGHNEAVLKTVWEQSHKGSNPFPSANEKDHREWSFSNNYITIWRSTQAGRRGRFAKPLGRIILAPGFKSPLLRQKRTNFCLPKVCSFFIQAAGLAYHHRTKCGAYHQGRQADLVSHHASACISSAEGCINCGLMRCNTLC